MKLQIERVVAEAMCARFPAWQVYLEQLKIANRMEVPVEALDAARLDALIGLTRQRPNNSARVAMLEALQPLSTATHRRSRKARSSR